MHEDSLLTDVAIAKMLNVSPAKLRVDRVKRCGIAFIKIGGLVRYDPADIADYKAASRRVFNAIPKV